jgi:hypothetical protein
VIHVDPFDPRDWPVPQPEDTCFISLSSRVDCHAIVDRVDYEWALAVGSGLWCHTYGSGEMCPETGVMQRPDGMYARKTVGGRTLFLHREICRRAHGEPPLDNYMADHHNGHTLDCRRVNLSWATRSQNAKNVPGTKLREANLRRVGRSF